MTLQARGRLPAGCMRYCARMAYSGGISKKFWLPVAGMPPAHWHDTIGKPWDPVVEPICNAVVPCLCTFSDGRKANLRNRKQQIDRLPGEMLCSGVLLQPHLLHKFRLLLRLSPAVIQASPPQLTLIQRLLTNQSHGKQQHPVRYVPAIMHQKLTVTSLSTTTSRMPASCLSLLQQLPVVAS